MRNLSLFVVALMMSIITACSQKSDDVTPDEPITTDSLQYKYFTNSSPAQAYNSVLFTYNSIFSFKGEKIVKRSGYLVKTKQFGVAYSRAFTDTVVYNDNSRVIYRFSKDKTKQFNDTIIFKTKVVNNVTVPIQKLYYYDKRDTVSRRDTTNYFDKVQITADMYSVRSETYRGATKFTSTLFYEKDNLISVITVAYNRKSNSTLYSIKEDMANFDTNINPLLKHDFLMWDEFLLRATSKNNFKSYTYSYFYGNSAGITQIEKRDFVFPVVNGIAVFR